MNTPNTTSRPRWRHLIGAQCLALGLIACAGRPTIEQSEDELQIYPIDLGQGVILDTPPGLSPARGPCVDFAIKTDQLLETQAVAVSATSERDLADKLSLTLGGQIPIKGVKTSLDATFEGRWSDKGTSENVALIARVKSVRQRAVRSTPSEGNLCRTSVGGTIDSVERFISECGELWNDRRDLGGTFVVTWDTSRMTQQETDDLKAKLGVGNSPESGMGSLVGRLTRLSTTSRALSEIRVDVIGYPVFTHTDIPAFISYLGGLTSDIAQAHAKGLATDPSYGVVLEQSFRAYTRTDLNVCTNVANLPGDADKVLECTTEAQLFASNLSATDSPLEAQIELAKAWLDETQAGTKIWPAPARENRTAVEDWLTSVSACRASMSKTLKDCQAARQDWSTSIVNATPLRGTEVCKKCLVAEACKPEQLAARGRALPVPVAAPFRGQPTTTHDAYVVKQGDPPVHLGSIKDRVCVLSGVYGGLYGGGESARVEIQGSEYWLIYDTRRTSPNEKGFAHAICVDALHFDNGSGAAPSLYDPLDGQCKVDRWQQTPMLDSSVCSVPPTGGFLAIAGVRGRFDHHQAPPRTSNDYVRVERTPSRTADGSVEVSQEGASLVQVRWRTSGVELTTRNEPAMLFNQPVKAAFLTGARHAGKLGIAVSEGLCYFTQLGGSFWTAADGARIEEMDGEWALITQSGCQSAIANLFPDCERRLIEASVQCVKFDQR